MKIGLAFSAGKDSLACLFLNKDRLNDVIVIWVNTGKNYPETLAIVKMARDMCHYFVEIIVDRDAQNNVNGIPADVVPIAFTKIGQQFSGKKDITIQPYISCCYENIGSHLHNAALDLGITHLIRGQRNDESHKSTAQNGTVIDGITYLHPIENWTKEQVLGYVAQHIELPQHFSFNHTSLDCYDCTAFTKESTDRIAYTKKYHPRFYAEYAARKAKVDESINQALNGV